MPRPELNKTCSLWYCTKKHYAAGYCQRHYHLFIKYGSPVSPHDSDLLVVLAEVERLRAILAKMG